MINKIRADRIKKYALLTIMILLFAACQPTPEKEFVETKNQDLLEEKIEQSQETAENIVIVNFPQRYSAQYSDGKTSIIIDADVIYGDYAPVALEHPITITQDMADIILDVFVGDSDFYNEENVQTKEELENEILALLENLNDPDADWAQATKDNPKEYEKAKNEKEAYIDTLKALMADAPSEKTTSYASRIFQEKIINQPGVESESLTTNNQIIQGFFDGDRSAPAFIKILNSDVGNGMYYQNFDMGVTRIFTPSPITYGGNVIEISEESMTSIGISDIQAIDMVKKKAGKPWD